MIYVGINVSLVVYETLTLMDRYNYIVMPIDILDRLFLACHC